jgi:hypothetical protein
MGEWYQELRARLGRRKVTVSPGCNNMAKTIDGLGKMLKSPPCGFSPSTL